ncbi:uncharacterized protein zgc:112496 [Rhincodon typus]|uniref:uncharacterized protein zgc:112496 n=1 Tax=Rhincodon typus TaxID=259920 RepID=UPI0009A2DE4E|nr:uncharacterized protein zgc:112496 [Rhincodon typus]XP_048465480.1 uncharacterized protein zgc:112496 [Rhincodon typus]XP_048465481.1 uncharacterized protein zgc:112496 [Rhincodon typus]XP_048465482.1 uncharacterized protein zgc:112496 [Rhincodon typus]XP_048465483.1 uncharacterized protein zgc:112496 [Rhincodon typus]
MTGHEILYNCKNPTVWRSIFAVYGDVVEAKAMASKGKKASKLIALDKWYQEALPEAVCSRKEKFLTHAELVQLMEWKLTRGKFRPTLQQMVMSNSRESVEACTRKAFKLLPDVSAAITELSKLKAVGPATASAVLVAGAPQEAAFMADEAVESVPGLVPIKYTLKHYILYLHKVRERATQLNNDDSLKDWTPHRIEQCLWTWAVGQQIKPLLLKGIVLHQSKRLGKEEGTTARPAKRQKTQC